MKSFINSFIRSNYEIILLRMLVITVFMLFETYKWFEFEVIALEPWLSTVWLNTLYTLFGIYGGIYFLGIVKTITFLALIIGFYSSAVGILGGIIVIVTGITTLSLLLQLGNIDSFIIKDVILIGASVVLLRHDLKRYFNIKT